MNIFLKKVTLLYGALIITILGGTITHGLIWQIQDSTQKMQEDYDSVDTNAVNTARVMTVLSKRNANDASKDTQSTNSDTVSGE